MNQGAIGNAGAGHGSLKACALGFCFSVALTAAAFAMVMVGEGLPRGVVLAVITCAAVVQILVQLHFFLHLDNSSSMRWNVMALLFTAAIMFLFVGGSLWIMFNLYERMM